MILVLIYLALPLGLLISGFLAIAWLNDMLEARLSPPANSAVDKVIVLPLEPLRPHEADMGDSSEIFRRAA